MRSVDVPHFSCAKHSECDLLCRLYAAPGALGGVLTYVGLNYDKLETWVTEFGTNVKGEEDMSNEEVRHRQSWAAVEFFLHFFGISILFFPFWGDSCTAACDQPPAQRQQQQGQRCDCSPA